MILIDRLILDVPRTCGDEPKEIHPETSKKLMERLNVLLNLFSLITPSKSKDDLKEIF